MSSDPTFYLGILPGVVPVQLDNFRLLGGELDVMCHSRQL